MKTSAIPVLVVLGLLPSFVVSTPVVVKVQDRRSFPHNATLHRRDNINTYGGCGNAYGYSNAKNIVKNGYHDMLRMTARINPFLIGVVDGDGIQLDPGPMETRFFGDISGGSKTSVRKRDFIRGIFQVSAHWYPWYPFDWIGGRRIQVYCGVDQPTKRGTTCASKLGQPGLVGAYAVNYQGVSKIVFCKPFFATLSLDERKHELDQLSPPVNKNDLFYWSTRAHFVFHEMTHLAVIEGRQPGENVVLDQNERVDRSGQLVYGPRRVEQLAIDRPEVAYLNADNYAWYATAKWFSQYYGDPNSALPSTTSIDEDNNILSVFDDDDSAPAPVQYEEPDYDEISDAEATAFQAGDYTPSGWLGGKTLRILPLGDSITFGAQSSDGNGYRQDLVSILTKAGNQVEMIGSVQAGTMAANSNEGHSGATISQIASYTRAYRQRPNVILLHAGTNDLDIPSEPATAPQRLDALVAQLVAACPDATIIVARIIPSTHTGIAGLLSQFNNDIAKLMEQRARNGQHVTIVDMPSGVTTADLSDGLHPNDEGYNKMAIKWAIALTGVDSIGWITPPVNVTCSGNPTWLPQGQVFDGAGLGSNSWLKVACAPNPVSGQCSCENGKDLALTPAIMASTAKCDMLELTSPIINAVHFADLNGDGRAEYLYVDNSGAVTAFLNLGGPDKDANAGKIAWSPRGQVANSVGASRSSVQFADINGDGRADYLWIHDDGSVDCWLNMGGPDNGPNAAKVTWNWQGTIAVGVGKDGAGVRFADINGDGRAEYLYVGLDGSIEAWLNQGGPSDANNASKVTWLSQGVIAPGVGQTRDNLVLADVNGDGRADYLAVSRTDGSVQMWLNGGGPDNGNNAAKVIWNSHGSIAPGVGNNGKGVMFADLNGDGRAEYLDVAYDTSAVGAWLNTC